MTPTLRPGDTVLVRHGAPVQIGAVVLARFRSRPELDVIKRVAGGDAMSGWLLGSDNSRVGSDSRELGTADVAAVALWVFRGPVQGARNAGRSRLASLWQRFPHRLPPPPPAGL